MEIVWCEIIIVKCTNYSSNKREIIRINPQFIMIYASMNVFKMHRKLIDS